MQENEITLSPKGSGLFCAVGWETELGLALFSFGGAIVYLTSTTGCIRSRRSNQASGVFFTAQGMSDSEAETIKLQSTALARQKLSLKHPDRGKRRARPWPSRDGAEPAEKAALPAQEVFCLCVNTGRLSSSPAEKVIIIIIIIPSLSNPSHSFLAGPAVGRAAASSRHPVLPAGSRLLLGHFESLLGHFEGFFGGLKPPQLPTVTGFAKNAVQG